MKKSLLKVAAVVVFAAMVLGLIGGCQKAEKPAPAPKEEQNAAPQDVKKNPFPVTIVDTYGAEVTIEKEPQRIVALAPSVVEVLYELGLGDRIVGVTEYSDYPKEALEKEKVGGFNGVNLERIVELKPDLVLAGTASEEVFQKLTDLNIKTIVAEPRTLDGIADTFKMIGSATGTADKAKVLIDGFNAKITEVKEKVKDAPKVKAYYALSFGKQGNWTAGKGTFISDIINIAGGENIPDDVESWKEYSVEQIIERDPEVILLSGMVANGDKDILDNEKGYKETTAVKDDRVVIINADLVQRPGPRIVQGIDIIAKALHPEIFGE